MKHEKVLIWLAYGSMLVGIKFYPVYFLALVLAITLKRRAQPLASSHASFLIRTFLYSLAGYTISLLLASSSIGVYVLILVNLWIAYRCIFGMWRHLKDRSI